MTQSDTGYDAAISRWAVNAARRANIVAFVKDEADVASALKYARAEKLPIAVRGGGRSPLGASSQADGLVIDLSRYLGSVRVDPAKKLAYIGGGAIWETVEKAAIQHGLASVSGTVNHVCCIIFLHVSKGGKLIYCDLDRLRRVNMLMRNAQPCD